MDKLDSKNRPGNQASQKALTLLFQGESWANRGMVEKALACYVAAERIARLEGGHETVKTCFERRIALLLESNEFEEADRIANEGLSYLRLLDRREDEIELLKLRSRSYQKRGRYQEAIESIFEGLELAKEYQRVEFELDFIIELAETALSAKEFADAKSHGTAGLNRAIMLKDALRTRTFARIVEEASTSLKKKRKASLLSQAMDLLPPLKIPFSDKV